MKSNMFSFSATAVLLFATSSALAASDPTSSFTFNTHAVPVEVEKSILHGSSVEPIAPLWMADVSSDRAVVDSRAVLDNQTLPHVAAL